MIAALDEKDQLNQLAFLWAAKEAMYKKYEQLGIDFAKDFNILELTKEDRGSVPAQILHKGNHISVHLDYYFGADYICVTCYNQITLDRYSSSSPIVVSSSSKSK